MLTSLALPRLHHALAAAVLVLAAACTSHPATQNDTSGVAAANDANATTGSSTPADASTTGSLSLDEATAPAGVTQLQVLLLAGSTCLTTPATTASGITLTVSNSSGTIATTTPTTTTSLPAGVTASCVVSNMTQDFQSGQTVTLNNIPVGTYSLLVVWEDVNGNAIEEGQDPSVTIAAGANAVANIIMGTTLATTGSSGSTGSLTINFVQAATMIAFAGTALNEPIDSCGAVDVQLQDAAATNSPLVASITIGLATTSTTGGFYSDSACLVPTSSTVIAAGSTDSTVYYRDTTAGSPTLTATDASSLNISAGASLATIAVAAPSKLLFTSAALTEAVSACGPITFETQDTGGIASIIAVALPLTITSTSATGTFFADSACANQILTNFNLGLGSDIATLYYKDTTAGTYTITLTDPAATFGSATTTATIH